MAGRPIGTMRRATLVLGFALSICLLGTRSWASDPSALRVTPRKSAVTWTGETYSNAIAPSPDACLPASVATEDCDHVLLAVSVPAGYWNENPGALKVSIQWDDPSNDFDLYLYRGDQQVAASEQQGTASELLQVPDPSGDYEIRVVPNDVLLSGYSGSVSLVRGAVPSPSPSPAPSPAPSPTPSPSPSAPSDPVSTDQVNGTAPTTNQSDTEFPAQRSEGETSTPLAALPQSTAGWYRAEGFSSFTATATSVDRSVFFHASVAASPTPVPAGQELRQPARTTPVSGTFLQISPVEWMLLPAGLLLLLGVTYLILEPETDAGVGTEGAPLPFAPGALLARVLRRIIWPRHE